MSISNVIDIKNVSKSFFTGLLEVKVLKDVSLTVDPKTFLIIFGPSGCGKSTLLHIMLGLEKPSTGKVVFIGQDLYQEGSDEDSRSEFRKNHIGMVYQQANWIKSLTVAENVAFPILLRGIGKYESLKKASEMLAHLGMADWANYIPTELSSGQQQKVALARALVTDPEVIIADEPTGNLDYESGQELMKLMTTLNNQGKTIIMVTHDLEYLTFAKSAVEMLDGKIISTYTEKNKAELMKHIKYKRGINDNQKSEVKPKQNGKTKTAKSD